jgi:hypothetical protein
MGFALIVALVLPFALAGIFGPQLTMIAHAMGGIDGHTYTDSMDAFVVSLTKGFQWFARSNSKCNSDQRLGWARCASIRAPRPPSQSCTSNLSSRNDNVR